MIFILQEPLTQEVSKIVNPWGNCLEQFDILRNTGIASYSGGDRMTEYQFEVWGEFVKNHCHYYVFKWMPEHYPERNYVSYGWYHEYRLDLTEEGKQGLQEVGAWPDEFGQFSIKEKTIELQERIPLPVSECNVLIEQYDIFFAKMRPIELEYDRMVKELGIQETQKWYDETEHLELKRERNKIVNTIHSECIKPIECSSWIEKRDKERPHMDSLIQKEFEVELDITEIEQLQKHNAFSTRISELCSYTNTWMK